MTSTAESVKPRVTVVMTTYNHAAYVEQAVDSVLAQQPGGLFRLLVIDDASTDGTAQILDRYARDHPAAVEVIHAPVNRNDNRDLRLAVEGMATEFVAVLDGDDYWIVPDKLARQVGFLDANPGASMCFHDSIVVDQDGDLLRNSYARGRHIPHRGHFRDIARWNYIGGNSPLIRRSALVDLAKWADPYEFGDWTLYLFAAEHGWIGYLPERMGAYRKHARGSYTSMPRAKILALTCQFLKDFGERFPPERKADFDRGVSFAYADMIANQLHSRNLRTVGAGLRTLKGYATGMHLAGVMARTLGELPGFLLAKASERWKS